MNDDPLALYLIVRKDLNMSVGKMCAQIGHAVEHTTAYYLKSNNEEDKKKFDYYLNGSRKIVLHASDSEWEKLKEEIKNDPSTFVVVDAGLTEIKSGTETCISAGLIFKNKRSKLLKQLQALK